MGSMTDWIADKEREEQEARRQIAEALMRQQIKSEMDDMSFEDLRWLWENKEKIAHQKKLIDILA